MVSIKTHPIAEELKKCGIQFVVNLPDHLTENLQQVIANDPQLRLIRIAREEEGVGICTGLYFGGRKSVLLIQSAGMFIATNALNGVACGLQIPLLMLVGYRGGMDDPMPVQVPKGLRTEPYLRAMRIPYDIVNRREDIYKISQAHDYAYASSGPVAILLGRGAV